MSVIVLEFNELTPSLMDRFIAEGHLPGFKRLRGESVVCTTDAEESPPNLEPWIQWVTVHTGLSFADHKVFDLGDGPKLKAPRIWDILSDAGKKVWICGSMNAAIQGEKIDGLVLPDPWATGIEPYPRKLFAPFFDLVRTYVQEYTRDKPPLAPSDYLKFGLFMASHGLSPKTVSAAAAQLAGERSGLGKWRRAAILDRLQWDVFRHFQKRLKPALSTFFLNSTAHYQHYYWRNHDSEPFLVKPTAEDQREYADAILFGYKKMDEIVTECLADAGPDDTIVLCTALGQQPLLKYENEGGRQLFKIHDPATLLKFAGVEAPFRYAPVMAEEFRLFFDDEAAAMEAETRLTSLRAPDGSQLMRARRAGVELYCACELGVMQPQDGIVRNTLSNTTVPFYELFYALGTGIKSGMHHPHGILWFRLPDRRHAVVERLVSLQELAPTFLQLCGVEGQGRFAFPPMPEIAAGAAAKTPALAA